MIWRSSIGFDRMLDLANDAMNDRDNYPLYDIERTGEDQYRISLALAGSPRMRSRSLRSHGTARSHSIRKWLTGGTVREVVGFDHLNLSIEFSSSAAPESRARPLDVPANQRTGLASADWQRTYCGPALQRGRSFGRSPRTVHAGRAALRSLVGTGGSPE
jgi:hypothetical protein